MSILDNNDFQLHFFRNLICLRLSYETPKKCSYKMLVCWVQSKRRLLTKPWHGQILAASIRYWPKFLNLRLIMILLCSYYILIYKIISYIPDDGYVGLRHVVNKYVNAMWQYNWTLMKVAKRILNNKILIYHLSH
jgi:hypothetical protein